MSRFLVATCNPFCLIALSRSCALFPSFALYFYVHLFIIVFPSVLRFPISGFLFALGCSSIYNRLASNMNFVIHIYLGIDSCIFLILLVHSCLILCPFSPSLHCLSIHTMAHLWSLFSLFPLICFLHSVIPLLLACLLHHHSNIV